MAEKRTNSFKADIRAGKKDVKNVLLNDTAINEVLNTLYYGYTDLKDVAIKENIKNNIEALLLIESGKLKADTKTREEIEEKTHKEYWEKQIKQKAEYYKTLLASASDNPISQRSSYIKFVNYITESIRGKNREQAKEEIINAYGNDLLNIDEITPTFIIYYLSEEKDIDEKQAFKISITSFLTGDNLTEDLKKLREDYLNEIEEDNLKYVAILCDIRMNIRELIAQAELKENNRKMLILYDVDGSINNKKAVPFKLPYTEYLTVAETEMLNIITTKKFMLDYNAVKYSEEVIHNLEQQDHEILDYITLTLYRNGYYYFTDRHIATAYYKKTPTATVSEAQLKEINDSLARIQNINLPVGYISEEINKKGKKAKIKRDSKLIWLDVVNYDYETKSTVYRIVDRPPYYDYAQQTGRLNKYKREIITRDIKGIQHDTKNTTLKQRLIRNILSLNSFNDVTMPIYEVYNILAITDNRKYSEARKKAKSMLEDLKQNYNFEYEFKRKSGTVTGIKFTKYTDRPLEKQKNFS